MTTFVPPPPPHEMPFKNIVWEKNKMLVINIFSLFHNVLYLTTKKYHHFSRNEIIVWKPYEFWEGQSLLSGKGLNKFVVGCMFFFFHIHAQKWQSTVNEH